MELKVYLFRNNFITNILGKLLHFKFIVSRMTDETCQNYRADAFTKMTQLYLESYKALSTIKF